MKKLLLLLLTIVSLQAKAQFINLPDSNFRNALIVINPSLFNSFKQLDTNLAKTSLPLTSYVNNLVNKNIRNPSGIEYFINSTNLNLSENPLIAITKLPPNCSNLNIENCNITSLQNFVGITNSQITNISIRWNSINDFRLLPSTIKILSLSYSNLTKSPLLPLQIKTLDLSFNSIDSIKGLNDSIQSLIFEGNSVSAIITQLPNNLINLSADGSKIYSISNFPDSLNLISLKNNNLSSLPQLPPSLQSLVCNNNKITSWPNLSLPTTLSYLNCSNNQLSTLSNINLPLSLTYLNCSFNNITNLPSFSSDSILLEFYCQKNRITTLPNLPNSLQNFNCSFNRISLIPNIPKYALEFYCDSNLLSTFPTIIAPPNNPNFYNRSFSFAINNISQLPSIQYFPQATYVFNVSSNPLNNIDSLFKHTLDNLYCSNIPARRLPDTIKVSSRFWGYSLKLERMPYFNVGYELRIPFSKFDTLATEVAKNIEILDYSFTNVNVFSEYFNHLHLIDNPVSCIPKSKGIHTYISADSSVLRCIPPKGPTWVYEFRNTYGIDSLSYLSNTLGFYYGKKILKPSFCNPTNNKNNCSSFPTINGSVYVDENKNGAKDPNESFRQNVDIRLTTSNRTTTNQNGIFQISSNNIGLSILTLSPPRFYTAVPGTINFNFSKYDTLVNVPPIALQKTISKDSLAVKITPINWAARPGFPYPFLVQYENVGSNTVNANINLSFNSNALNYDSSSTTVNATTGNIQLLKNSFTPGIQGGFISYFRVKPSATLLGTNLKTWASIVGGTALASDTTRRIIGGSYDPNDKLATPQLTTTQVAEGQFINYTVRFQNTGTDTAFTVVIADTLNSLLQANTFEMLGSSHTCKTIIQDNKIYFEFRNILLPDSTTNLIGSNGFVNFRIKPISSVALNTSIPNKAAIYFDYNEPIITNTASTLISNTILPLQLVRFNVLYKQSSGVLFNWETKNEQAIKEFVVEESKDAINFKALQQTQSKGNGDNTYFSNANYTNIEMIGSKFYRLKTISSNGNIAYSQIVKLNFDKNIQPFIILQNPVKGSLQIQVNAQSLNNTEALLLNQEGKVLQGFKLQLGSQTIGLINLGAGIYTLKTKEGSKMVVIAP